MAWKRGIPEKEGHYWLRFSEKDDQPFLVNLIRGDYEMEMAGEYRGSAKLFDKDGEALWWGPLEPPPIGPTGTVPKHCRVHVKKRAQTWEYVSDLFCPSCGKPSVWVELGDGDYYQGPDYVCTNCDSGFTLPSGVGPVSEFCQVALAAIKDAGGAPMEHETEGEK